MTIDKAKLKALAEAAGPKDYFAPRPYEEDRHYDDQELKRLEFMAEADPAAVLALLAEIEQLRNSHEQVCTNYNRVSFTSEERGEQIDQLKAENEALRKALGEISGQVDGNIRCTVRDLVNGLPDVQDIYGYCDAIDEIIDAAMAKEASHDHE